MAILEKWSGLLKAGMLSAFAMLFAANSAFAGEADLVVPNLAADPQSFNLLLWGIGISVAGLIFGLIEFIKVKNYTWSISKKLCFSYISLIFFIFLRIF